MNCSTAEGKDPALFIPNFNMSVIQPQLSRFVSVAHATLSTPAMKTTIAKCFAERGLFDLMRSPEMQEMAHMELIAEQELTLVVPEEVEDVDDEDDD